MWKNRIFVLIKRHMMKKLLHIISLIGLVIFTTVSCQKEGAQDGDPSSSTKTRKNTIIYTTTSGTIIDVSHNGEKDAMKCFGANIVSNVYSKEGIGTITFDKDITFVAEGAFYDCATLTSITLPEGVTSIEGGIYKGFSWRGAFEGCSNLKNFNIPKSVTHIGASTFSGCSSLTSVTIPEGVTEISDGSFSGCSSLTSINIPEGVTRIGSGSFSDCSGLTNISIPKRVTEIGARAFLRCYSLNEIAIPESVTTIGEEVFVECGNLAGISLPESIDSIGNRAFARSGLTSIDFLPKNVTAIGQGWFSDCLGLTSISIPEWITEIGHEAFGGCTNVEHITIHDKVTQIGTGALPLSVNLKWVRYEFDKPLDLYGPLLDYFYYGYYSGFWNYIADMWAWALEGTKYSIETLDWDDDAEVVACSEEWFSKGNYITIYVPFSWKDLLDTTDSHRVDSYYLFSPEIGAPPFVVTVY